MYNFICTGMYLHAHNIPKLKIINNILKSEVIIKKESKLLDTILLIRMKFGYSVCLKKNLKDNMVLENS